MSYGENDFDHLVPAGFAESVDFVADIKDAQLAKLNLLDVEKIAKHFINKNTVQLTGKVNDKSLSEAVSNAVQVIYKQSIKRKEPKAQDKYISEEIKIEHAKVMGILIEELRDRLRCREENLTEAGKFLAAVFPSGYSDFEKYSILGWIQHAKLKFLGKSELIKDHFMLNFQSQEQGTGKSTTALAMISPLFDFHVGLKISSINNMDQIGPTISKSYITFFDELIGLKNASVDTLKSLITSKTIDNRTYFSQDVNKTTNNSTFISTSNGSLAKNFRDNAMRRFLEITFKENINFEALKNVDMIKMWQGILDVGPLYFSKIETERKKHQESLSTKSYAQQFMESLDLIPTSDSDSIPYPKKDLYQEYVKWCEENRIKIFSSTVFFREINPDLKSARVAENDRRISSYLISSGSPLVGSVINNNNNNGK